MKSVITTVLTSPLAMRLKRPAKDAHWWFRGRAIRNPELPKRPRSVLFLCKGNICRSPFAEHLARRTWGDAGGSMPAFASAGLRVTDGEPPPPEALTAARDHGISLLGHGAKGLTDDMLRRFDIVVAMDAGQLEHLRQHFGRHRDKFFLLPLFEEGAASRYGSFRRFNLVDPYGRALDDFRACYRRIDRCLQGLANRLQTERD
jgi:protein-tyrosine phosphatase